MKITRKQLRRLINESVYGTGKSGYSKTRPEDPIMHVSQDIRRKLDPLITHDDPAYQRQGYDLATTMQSDMTVFPDEGVPYTKKPYEGDDYLEDLDKSYSVRAPSSLLFNLKNAYDAMEGKPAKGKLLHDLDHAYDAAAAYTRKMAASLGIGPKEHDKINKLWVRLFGSAFPKD
jgi:hypothetical protein